MATTATKTDRRTQLALWVGGQGAIQFAMGNERGKGVILEAGRCPEGLWTHLAVSMEGRKVSFNAAAVCDASAAGARNTTFRTSDNLRLITASMRRVERIL